jgi:formylglycine-generating enzyme required for sulfatase activity
VSGTITLSQNRLDFGTHPLGSSTELSLTVRNDGSNRLAIRNATLNNAAFTVTAKPDTIQPGGSGDLTVQFSPTAVGLQSATLQVSSSDLQNPTVPVTITGGAVDTSAGGTALLNLSTRFLDVGQVVQNLTGTAILNIGNIGKDTLRVSGISFSHQEFSAAPSQLAVAPGAEVPVTVSFSPLVTGEVNGTMVLFTNDQLRTSDTVLVRATGVTEGGTIEEREVFIQGGTFPMGLEGEVGPVRQVTLSSFYMDAFEITNEQYKEFIDAGGYNNQAYWSDEGWTWRTTNKEFDFDPQNPRPRFWAASGANPWEADIYSNAPNTPVVGVSWYEAEAFANFSGKSLPTEAQWEFATRGSQGRIYPWGDIFLGDRLNHGQVFSPYYDMSDGYKYTAPISVFPQGQTPTGIFSLAGNVMEWIADWYGPYNTAQTVNPTGPASGLERVLRGGSWAGSNDFARGFHRNRSQPKIRYRDGGIRLVRNF